MEAQEQQLTEAQGATTVTDQSANTEPSSTVTGQTENAETTAAVNAEAGVAIDPNDPNHPDHPHHRSSALHAASQWRSSVDHAMPHHSTSLEQ